MTASHYKRATCVHCNKSLEHSCQAKIYCSNACKVAAWKAANPEKHKARVARYQAQPSTRARKVCLVYAGHCESCCRPYVSKRQRRYCGRECELKAARDTAVAAAQAQHKAAAKVITCEICAAGFCPLYGASHAQLCVPCACVREREHKRTHRLARKARQRGAQIEAVNPLKVFERDGWRCRLCGARTPKAKRGTLADDAPELDHIIPLSKGGAHSYLNTQCACRRCNGLKSDKPMGQLLLIG